MNIDKEIKLFHLYSFFKSLVFQRGIFMIFLIGKGITMGQIGVLQATLFLTTFLSEVPAGYFGDKFKRKVSIILGLFLTIVSGVGFLVFDSFYAFLCLFVLEGLGMAFVSGSDQSLLYDNIKGAKGNDEKLFLKAISRSRSISFYALGVATLAGGFLQKISWNAVYGSFSIAMALALLSVLFISDDTSSYQPEEDENIEDKDKVKTRDFLKSTTGKHLLVLILIIAVFDSALLNYFMYSQKLFHHFNVDTAVVGALYMISRFTSGYGYSLAPALSKRFSVAQLCYMSMFLSGALLLLNLFNIGYMSVVVFLVVMILPNVFDATFSDYFHGLVPSKIRATVISTRSMIESGVVSAFYLGTGKLLEVFPPHQAMAYLAAFPFICIFVLLINKEFTKKPTLEES